MHNSLTSLQTSL